MATKKDDRATVEAARIAGKSAILVAIITLIGFIFVNIDKVKEIITNKSETDNTKNKIDTIKYFYGNTIPEMIKIKGGSYTIGLSCNELDSLVQVNYGKKDDFLNEIPQRKITINDFEISKYEITVKQFNEYLKYNNKEIKELPNKFNSDNQPIVDVTWYEANNYCLWISQKTGESYRLPYEIEWEIASKGNSQNIYSWGNDEPNDENCNFKYSNINSTISNGGTPSNCSVFGIYNMSGNVAEWCKDWYHADHYKINTKGKIIILRESQNKVIRGGGWKSAAFHLRCTARYYAPPNNKSDAIGFRIVKSLN